MGHCSLVRRALTYWTYVVADVLLNHTYDAFQYFMCHPDNMAPATEYYGLMLKDGTWLLSDRA
eukprot:82863-Prorocentrum_lima.AAC.1